MRKFIYALQNWELKNKKKYSGGKTRVHTHRIFYGPRITNERNGVDYKKEENTKKKKFTSFTSTRRPNSEQQQQPKRATRKAIKHPQIIIYQVRDCDILHVCTVHQ
jgi:hypothetical protein